MITSLKKLFRRENSQEIRSAIVRVFAQMRQDEVVPFLIDTLQHSDDDVRADCIHVCGFFGDPAIIQYIEPFLSSENPHVRSQALAALWQFPHYRLKLTLLLNALLQIDDKPTQKVVLHTLGEIKARQELPRLLNFLEHTDIELRLLAAIALAKLEHEKAPPAVAEFILHPDAQLASQAKRHLRYVPPKAQKEVEKIVHHRLSQQLHQLLTSLDAQNLVELAPPQLAELRTLYQTSDDWEEVAKIDAVTAGQSFD